MATVDPIRDVLSDCEAPRLMELAESLDPFTDLRELVERAVVDEPPATITDGGLFRRGYHDELDEIRRGDVPTTMVRVFSIADLTAPTLGW